MRKHLITGAVIAALATGGVALAQGGGPIGDALGIDDERQQEFAHDLATELDGVNAGQVDEALDTVRENEQAEHQAEMAKAIADNLDGVSADQVEKALTELHKEMRAAFESGERPERSAFDEALAEKLGVDEQAVEDALEAAYEAKRAEHHAELEERLDEAVENGNIDEDRADEIREHLENGPGPGGFGPGQGPHPSRPGFGPGPGFGGPR